MAAPQSLGQALAGIAPSVGGSTNYSPNNPGTSPSRGSGTKSGAPATVGGNKRAPTGPPTTGKLPPQARPPKPQAPQAPKQPPQQKQPQFSATNPMLMTQPPPTPHPGVLPPYPDARSPQPQMLPNGSVIMPPPTGFIGAGMPPRVPPTFIPGMTGLLGRLK